jgi:hypothetical protein
MKPKTFKKKLSLLSQSNSQPVERTPSLSLIFNPSSSVFIAMQQGLLYGTAH